MNKIMQTHPDKTNWIHADFNGMLESNLLCLSHSDAVKDKSGNVVQLSSGMAITVFDDDIDEYGKPDDIFASGTVESTPKHAQCHGSKWALRIDLFGIRHESDLSRDREQ